jgi:hypothetical protein
MVVSGLTADPETLDIPELAHRSFTAGEFAAIEPPACPVCGAKVTIQRIEVTLNAEDEAANGRSYIAGMWECPRGCDPRTGRRRHFSQSFGLGLSGHFFECSCGMKETDLTGAELVALREEHHE